MSARFRIRTPQGQELSFASEEMFADFVRSGELSEGDLVYDASTGEWSPALTHSVVLEAGSDRDEGPGPEAKSRVDLGSALDESPEASSGPGATGPGDSSLGFDLAPEQTPEEASAAFVREMEEERAAEFERSHDAKGLRAEDGSQGLLKDIQRVPPTPPSVSAGGGATAGSGSPAPRMGEREPPKRSRMQRSRDAGNRRSVSGAFVMWIVALGVLGVAGLLGPDLVALAMGSGGAGEDVPTDVPVIADTEEALEARAEVRFLGSIRPRFLSLPAVPSAWLDGHYLANASQYPQVASVWNSYLARVRQVREEENEVYSEAYLSALDDARVSGANRTLRLATALSRFEREGGERVAQYDRAEELAMAALELHDLLLEREDRISYEPAVGSRVSVDPILQAAGSDAETQDLLEQALDRVLDALSAGGDGPVEARALPAWIFEGLREAVESE